MKRRNYRSWIPKTATEVVEETFDDGGKKSASYYLDGSKVGWRVWHETGELEYEIPMRDGVKHGNEYGFFLSGQVQEVTPYRNGTIHGTGKQWAEDGRVLITYKLTKGVGLDLWCGHENETLSEESYWPAEGQLGYRREWNDDEKTVNEEYWYLGGSGYHGPWRQWNSKGRLRRGYPQFYVRGSRVTKAQYLRACATDQTLPAYRASDDLPFRALPEEYVKQRRGKPSG